MNPGEDEAAQRSAAWQVYDEKLRRIFDYVSLEARERTAKPGQADDEDIQHFAEVLYTAHERELDTIDAALDAVEAADSREAAVAALTRATVGINALYACTTAAPLEIVSPSVNLAWYSSLAYQSFRLLHPLAKELERKMDERIERYLKVANCLTAKYKPDQYQLSVGFPQLISITLTWRMNKEIDLSSDLPRQQSECFCRQIKDRRPAGQTCVQDFLISGRASIARTADEHAQGSTIMRREDLLTSAEE